MENLGINTIDTPFGFNYTKDSMLKEKKKIRYKRMEEARYRRLLRNEERLRKIKAHIRIITQLLAKAKLR